MLTRTFFFLIKVNFNLSVRALLRRMHVSVLIQMSWRKDSGKLAISPLLSLSLSVRRQPSARSPPVCGGRPSTIANTLVLYSRLSPRRKPFSHINTPALSVERLTPPFFEYEEDRPRIEKEAYEALIREGGQPSHPIGITFSDAKKLREYHHIISYWTQFGECAHSPYSTQLAHWRAFRNFQDNIRERYESQNSFPDYLHHINELRRRYNLEGNADARLDCTEQSGLADWMEYQHQHLENCENLEEPLNLAKEELDHAKEELYEAGDSQFGDKVEEEIGSEAEGYSAPSREPHSWKKLNRKIHKAKTATKYKEREVQLLEHKANVAQADGSKEISEEDQTKAAEAMQQLEKAQKKVTKLELRLNLIEATRALASIQRELKYNKILVDWAEQQIPVIAAR